MSEKVWVVSTFGLRITHRKLTNFEVRNPQFFKLSHAAFSDWPAAHRYAIEVGAKKVEQDQKQLASSVKALARIAAAADPTK